MIHPPCDLRARIDGALRPTAPGPADRPLGRAEELDGLRGWASLSVVLFHFVSETFGARVDTWRALPVATLLNGNLAICIFFVISGEVLGRGFFAGRAPPPMLPALLRRWLRLWIPIMASCLAVLALQRAGWVFNQAASEVVGSRDWLGSFLVTDLAPHTIVYALYPPYIAEGGGEAINPFLWTMPLELAGSVVVFCLPRLWIRLTRPGILLGALIVALQATILGSYLSLFVMGFLFAWARSRPGWRALAASRTGQVAAFAAAVGGLAAAGYVHRYVGINPPWNVMLAPCIVMGCVIARPIRAFLTTPLSRALGKISFPLYLVQFPVLVSLTSWLILAGFDAERPMLSSVVISTVSALACLGAATLFLPVERAAIALGHRIGGRSPRAAPAHAA